MSEKDEKLDSNDQKTLSGKTLELSKTVEKGKIMQNFSHGRSKQVVVEVKRKRTFEKSSLTRHRGAEKGSVEVKSHALNASSSYKDGSLTHGEREQRRAALNEALAQEEERKKKQEEEIALRLERDNSKKEADIPDEPEVVSEPELKTDAQEPVLEKDVSVIDEVAEKTQDSSVSDHVEFKEQTVQKEIKKPELDLPVNDDDETGRKKTESKKKNRFSSVPAQGEKRILRSKPSADSRRRSKLTISNVLSDEEGERQRSMASMRRAQKKAKNQALKEQVKPKEKVIRDVVLPEFITVQELANRMAERAGDVIKSLINMGMMATINQSIDADTAQLVVEEFGHKFKRVADSDVEHALVHVQDKEQDRKHRAPVVTVMGHVDHGKTSLLDALRATDVVANEAGGITQHIGAYQVTVSTGEKITFIDTPGHAAFTAMRSRGAKVTDLVVLVVAADDSVMPQTIEAISHARAADVPILIAINKCDKPDANAQKVKTELLQHEVVIEEMGGDVQCAEVSAKTGQGLDALEELILLQAEILDLKASPYCSAQGAVIEAKVEKGRGSVATVLIQKGTLNIGDIFVAGGQWGRVRALINDRGQRVVRCIPGMPIEILGLDGTPSAGDDFVVVKDEAKAREVAQFRQRRLREKQAMSMKTISLEQMFSQIEKGQIRELPVIIKGDVQGSVEALVLTLSKLGNDDVKVRILHTGVGGINESDITLARASCALIIGFNVRANLQAREQARVDGVDVRYYSIIYDVSDDIKNALKGLLGPKLRESFLGYAKVLEVFSISKVGKIAGCLVTEGVVKRGTGVRLLRDDVVIYTGDLSTLQRFKDEVKEVKQGVECGMSFAKYQDIQPGDVVECFDMEEIEVEL